MRKINTSKTTKGPVIHSIIFLSINQPGVRTQTWTLCFKKFTYLQIFKAPNLVTGFSTDKLLSHTVAQEDDKREAYLKALSKFLSMSNLGRLKVHTQTLFTA